MNSMRELVARAMGWLISIESNSTPDAWEALQRWMDEDVRHRVAFAIARKSRERIDRLSSLRPIDGQVDLDLLMSPEAPNALNLHGVDGAKEIIDGRLYDVSKAIAVPSTEIISSVRPIIVEANDSLILRLKRQPEAVYDLPPRKFEELLADLLTDMGFEVELTKATRDGGRDILAYLKTEIGKLLCLVEAKKFRRDRHVGVEMVRSLYGVLCDEGANSAMLVTTSSFTKEAREFQKRHEWQIALHEYGDVVAWILKHGTRQEGRS